MELLGVKLVGLTALRLARVKRRAFHEPNFLLIGIRFVTFEVRRLKWALDVDKALALNSRLFHLILKLASCNTCNHPCLKLLHAARALNENWYTFHKKLSQEKVSGNCKNWLSRTPIVSKLCNDQSPPWSKLWYLSWNETELCTYQRPSRGTGDDPRESPVICTTTL